MLDLNKDVKYIKGVGPARAELLNSIGIFNLYDLITYFPKHFFAYFFNLYFNPVFLFFMSVFCIINSIIFLLLITIKSFFALVIPVYNKFLVSSIGADCGTHIITTSNSLPLRFMYCYTIAMF